MTIPDIGHCAGSGAEPAHGSIKPAAAGAPTGICPACSGRFALHPSGAMSLHDAAEIDQLAERIYTENGNGIPFMVQDQLISALDRQRGAEHV